MACPIVVTVGADLRGLREKGLLNRGEREKGGSSQTFWTAFGVNRAEHPPSVRAPQQMAPARPSRGCRFVQTPSQQGGGSRVGGRRLRHARQHSSPTSSAPAKHRDRLLTVTPDPGATHARTPRCPLRSCLYMSTTAALTPSCAFCAYLAGLIHQRYIRTSPRYKITKHVSWTGYMRDTI